MIYSFDIFDTTLTRTVSSPHGILLLMAQDLQSSNSLPEQVRQHFPRIRVRAEWMTRLYKKKEDVRLDDIYAALAKLCTLDPVVTELLKQLELKTELASCRPIASTIAAIKAARSRGGRVVFISDMYLPKACIQAMLEKVGAYEPGDGIYVSGDTGLTKRSGSLFRHMFKKEGCSAKDVCHLGDHVYSDVCVPRMLGIKTARYHFKSSRYEDIIRRNGSLLASVWAGTSRSARLSKVMDPSSQVIHDTACHVIGPSLLFYVEWLLESAKNKGLLRLYFLSRDGEILFKIAQKVNRHRGYNLDLRYLHASREAWCWPALTDVGPFELSWMLDLDDALSVSIVSIAERLGLKAEVFGDCPSQIEKLKEVLTTPEFFSLIQWRRDDSYRDTVAYLRQQGVFDGVQFALVDVGWKGTLQYALSKIMDKEKARPPKGLTGFYFGLEYQQIYQHKNDELCSYFIDSRRPYLRNNVLFCEVFAASASYRTKGYACSGGACSPVEDIKDLASTQWDVSLQQTSILDFVDSFLAAYPTYPLEQASVEEALEKILELFIFSPSVQEAHVYGDFNLNVRFNEGKLASFAPPVSSNAWPRTYWVPGTLGRSGLSWLSFLWRAVASNSYLTRLCRQFYLRLHRN
jgi:predicted HAD superfamily hydrolase